MHVAGPAISAPRPLASPTVAEQVDHERLVRSLLGQLRVVFQPVVDLATGVVVGHEALIRGPAGSDTESAVALFERAAELGLHAELDTYSLELALTAVAGSARWEPEHGLFVNISTANLLDDLPEHVQAFLVAAPRAATCVLDVGEAQLRSGPAQVLRRLERLRELGWRVALADVGSTPTSWSMVGILDPDLVKLAPCVVDATSGLSEERLQAAVGVARDELGAVIVAVGVETSLHAGRAWELGAHLGQGWWFGYPREIGEVVHGAALPLPSPAPSSLDVVAERLPTAWRTTDERAVSLLRQRLLAEASSVEGEATVVVQVGGDAEADADFVATLATLGARCGQLTVALASGGRAETPGAEVIERSEQGILGGATVISVLGVESGLGLATRAGPSGIEYVLSDDLTVVAALARWVLLGRS